MFNILPKLVFIVQNLQDFDFRKLLRLIWLNDILFLKLGFLFLGFCLKVNALKQKLSFKWKEIFYKGWLSYGFQFIRFINMFDEPGYE